MSPRFLILESGPLSDYAVFRRNPAQENFPLTKQDFKTQLVTSAIPLTEVNT
jgi:hypothetical protein